MTTMGGYKVPGGASYLRVSLRLLAKLNPEVFFNVKLSHWHEHGPLVDFPRFSNMHIECHIYDDRDIPTFRSLDSVEQHGTLLNKVLNENKSNDNFSMILDPDFFMFRRNTVSEIVSHIEKSDLDAIGVSYPARYPIEYSWRFPQVYFMLSDNRKFDLTSINFKSGLDSGEHAEEVPEVNSFRTKILKRVTSSVFLQKRFQKTLHLLNQLLSVYSNRVRVNPRDTGWRLGNYIEGKSYEILPNVIEAPEGKIPLFNPDVFETENADQNLSSMPPQSAFLLRGILNGSRFENQNVLFRYLFFPFLKVKMNVRPAKWPNSSVIEVSRLRSSAIHEHPSLELDGADFYAFNQELFGVHLGHKGKANLKYGLDDLESQLFAHFD